MPKTRKHRHHDDGTAKWHEDMVKQHYLSMKNGELPPERLRISPKHYDEEADLKYMKYLHDTKKYLRNTPKTRGGRRTRRGRRRY
jgi:hypothetical protein